MSSTPPPAGLPVERFRSGVDGWAVAVLAIALGIPVAIVLHPSLRGPDADGARLVVFVTTAAVLVFFGWLFASTRYTMGVQALVIRSGPLRWTIPYGDIESIRPTASMLSSPAMSLRRLEIRYRGDSWILVSPPDREAFIAALRRRVPGLTVMA